MNPDRVYAHQLRPGDTVRVPGHGVVVIADIRPHETPVYPLHALGCDTWTLPGLTLDDVEDLDWDVPEITTSVVGTHPAPERQSLVYDITFRDGGSGMYAWNSEIHRTRDAAPL